MAVGASALIAGISYLNARHLILVAQEQTRTAQAEGLVVALGDQLITRDYAGLESRVIQTMADGSIESALVTDEAGKVLLHLQRSHPGAEPELLFHPRVLRAPTSPEARLSRDRGVTTRWSPVEAGTTVGWLQLRLWSSSTDTVLELLGRQYLVLGVLTAGLLSAVLLTSNREIRRRSQRRESELKRENELLERRALTDPLTGVLNRHGVEQALQHDIHQFQDDTRTTLAVCVIDLDDFKPVNDFYGHAIGDLLLTAVCKRLRGLLRENDIVGRLGGDEFVVVLHDCQEPDVAINLANRVTNSLSDVFVIEHNTINIGASIGIAFGEPTQTAEFDVMVALADQAMYDAKRAGKGCVVVAQ